MSSYTISRNHTFVRKKLASVLEGHMIDILRMAGIPSTVDLEMIIRLGKWMPSRPRSGNGTRPTLVEFVN